MATSVNVFFTDHEFSFIEKPEGYNMKKLKYSSVKLEPGIIENGIIYKKEVLSELIKDTFKAFKINSHRVNLIIHEELYTFRKIDVPKIYKHNEIKDYIESQIGKTIIIPFENIIMDYIVSGTNEENYEVIMFYAPEGEITEYIDIFYRMNLTVLRSDLPPLALHRLYYYRKHEDPTIVFERDIMFVAFFDYSYSIYIFDEEIPIFSKIQNLKDRTTEPSEFFHIVDAEIARIANYYKYNLNDGLSDISKIIVYNLTSRISKEEFNEYYHDDEPGIPLKVFDMKNVSTIVNTLIDRECYIPLACSLVTKGK